MMYVSGLICFVLMLTAEARVSNSSELMFCRETKECLQFDLVCKTEDYEVRHYDSLQWVSTEEDCYFMELGTLKAFKRLYKYITGENVWGTQIEMTSPVVTKVKRMGFWKPNRYTLSFLLPSEHQRNPPMPTDNSVYFHRTPPMYVYVQSYGGWTTTITDYIYSYCLSSVLDSKNANYIKESHYAVEYNSLMTLTNRHNEVWFMAEDEPKCGPN